jgi:hypothetical protein
MRILAIDPGLRNLAFCMLDSHGRIVKMGREDIFQGREISVSGAYEAIAGWCDRNRELLDSADKVVIERQFCNEKFSLSACLLIVQTTLQANTHGKFVLVHAMSVKRHFGIPVGKHHFNKREATKRAMSMCQDIRELGGKVDDIADAFLLAKYQRYLSFSPQTDK